MATIDKNMYERLKNWYDFKEECRPKNQTIMYVNSHDRALSDATIKKMMFEMTEEDVHGEMFISLYSAPNFYQNMRDYYVDISKLYMHFHNEDTPTVELINDYPPTCGWIVLIVQDIEKLSDDEVKMQEMMETILAFASRRSSIILVGNGDYKDVFSGCEYALSEMQDGITAKEEDNIVMIGLYNQEAEPIKESVTFDNPDDQRDELDFYWDITYEQLEKNYFDYVAFKNLLKETLEYIIPRVTNEYVYRKDLDIIEDIGAISREKHEDIEGCYPWEFDAAKKCAVGLHRAIVNRYGDNDDVSSERITIDVEIEERTKDYGAIHISGSTCTYIELGADNVSQKMDKLSEAIHGCTYMGDEEQLWDYVIDNRNEGKNTKEIKGVTTAIGNLMDGIKEAADRTVNKEPGEKVRRYKEIQNEDTVFVPQDDETGVRILSRDYDIDVSRVKGIEKLNPEEIQQIENCKLTRYIVILDESQYSEAENGYLEMTKKSQEEYDEFIAKMHQTMMRDGIRILDEGYGADEDELEWHITGCVVDTEDNDRIVGIMEVNTCVRTEEPDNGD